MIRLAVRAPADEAEAVLAELLELAPSGVEQVDGDGFVEYALYGAPGELPSLPEGEAATTRPIAMRFSPSPCSPRGRAAQESLVLLKPESSRPGPGANPPT